MKFPPCLSEAETIERAIAGANLARYGDGEFNLAIGRNCVSQAGNPKLAAELRAILEKAPKGCLPCLPNPYGGTPKKANWQRFENYNLNLGNQEYGSAFITRPDSAPWIDTADYWCRVRTIWAGKDVTLVKGSERSLRLDMMADAKSVREVWGTYRDAYASRGPDTRNNVASLKSINELMEAVGAPGHTVLMCLGATATVMAARLARKGVHAVDLGHLGMFMRHAGMYQFKPDDLLSPGYRALLNRAYREMEWGGSGHKQAAAVLAFAEEIGAKAILDYGSGQGLLAKALAPRRVDQYDPGLPSAPGLPKPTHLVVCSDVLEHVEPDKLDNVLAHLHSLAGVGAYFVIATRLANKCLPDGQNAHLIVKQPEWWLDKINAQGWKHHRPPAINEGHSVTVWLVR
jgi:hypothetical protein